MSWLLNDVNIGNNLQRLRVKHNLTQIALTRELSLRGSSMTRETYAKIERGIRNIKVSDLILIKALYDVDFSEFFEGLVPDDIPKLGQI